MATRHSTRSQPSGRARSNSTPEARAKQGTKPCHPVDLPDRDAILERLAEALALVETSHSVLDAAQEDWTGQSARRCSPAVRTLDHGIKALARVRSEVEAVLLRLL